MTTTPTKNDEWADVLAHYADAEEVVPDGYMATGDVLSKGDEQNAPGRISSLRFNGYVRVWNRRTGDMSLQPKWLLWQTMRKTFEDGSPVFTQNYADVAHIKPNYGLDLLCPLNPKSEMFEKYKHLAKGDGCKKHHIPNERAMWLHVRKSHKAAYEAMQEMRATDERRQDRELQEQAIRSNQELTRAVIAAQQGKPVEAPAAVAVEEKPKAELKTYQKPCDECGFVAEATVHIAAVNKLKAHKRAEHGAS